MKENLVILGSTGSIGTNTLDVISMHRDKYKVFALSAHSSVDLLVLQCKKFEPNFVHISDANHLKKIKTSLEKLNLSTQIISGSHELNELVANDEVDTVVCGISGSAGLESSLHAVKAGKKILLANKEPLVMCGQLFMEMAKKYKSQILPVDSEHNALHQCFSANENKLISKIILTASGGPFLNTPLKEFKNITSAEALKHPTWVMGPKISIDSATMMNKGLEIIEAMHLFGFKAEQIEAMIHPQSIIHSMVCYGDGSIIAQLSQNDMKIPISYCLGWPKRIKSGISSLNLINQPPLNFLEVAKERYPCFFLAKNVAKEGDSLPIVMNAANEVAVEAFLSGKLKFKNIHSIIEDVITSHSKQKIGSIEDVFEINKDARNDALAQLKRYNQ